MENIEEELGHKHLQEITIKYHSNHRELRYELRDKPRKQSNRIFIDSKFGIKVIMDRRTISAHKFRTRLGFKRYDFILTKEKSMLTGITSSFGGENMQTQYKGRKVKHELRVQIHKVRV